MALLYGPAKENDLVSQNYYYFYLVSKKMTYESNMSCYVLKHLLLRQVLGVLESTFQPPILVHACAAVQHSSKGCLKVNAYTSLVISLVSYSCCAKLNRDKSGETFPQEMLKYIGGTN